MAPWHRSTSFFVSLFLSTSLATAETGLLCTNGLDDDGDGLIDCDDPGCGADALVGPLDLRVSVIGPARVLLLSWSGADSGTSFDLASGDLSTPRGGCSFDSVLGGPDLVGTSVSDPRPGPGSSWFLVRAQTPCADGAFGTDSLGDERVFEPECRPGDVITACDGAPSPGTVSAWTECDDADAPFDVVIHLTNDTLETVLWWSAACPSTPEVDRLVSGADWFPVHICIVCANGDAEWLELAPGEDLVTDVGTWGSCMWDRTYRARFLVAEDCSVSDPVGPEDCPDARVVTTLPFVVGP